MSETFTPIAHVGEFGLIDRLDALLGVHAPDGDLLCGIGDDAAVYRVDEDRVQVITTDALVEGVHFDRSFVPLTHLGSKAISVNVSDVCAMNARPLYALVTIGLPRNLSVEGVEALYYGMRTACEAYGVKLIGGDTTAAPQLVVSVVVVGEAASAAVTYRRGARPGDLLCVTGALGGAYAGLQVLLDQRQAMQDLGDDYTPDLDPYRYVIERQLSPDARLDVVNDWAERRVRPRAVIDISDGLASEVHHLCRQSGCGAIVRGAALPIHPETRAVADERMEDVDTFALFGGEDYELLFALDPADLDRLDPEQLAVVGAFTEAGEGVKLLAADGIPVPLEPAGYAHWGGPEVGGDGAE